MTVPRSARPDATTSTSSADSGGFDLDVGVVYTYEDHFMPRLMETLSASGPGLRIRLLLVDNASGRDAQRWTAPFEHALVLRNATRRTYGENLNVVLNASTARYTLLMNTDMAFDPAERCLTRMVEFMDRRPRCGTSTCRILHADGGEGFSARRYQSPKTALVRRLGMGRFFPHEMQDYFYLSRSRRDSFRCDWVSGCFMLVRREAVQSIGRFDERFRKYFEDVDWCARTTQAGWDVLYHGDASCIHFEQRASKRLLSKDAWLHAQSYLRWLWKWKGRPPAAPEGLPIETAEADAQCGSLNFRPSAAALEARRGASRGAAAASGKDR